MINYTLHEAESVLHVWPTGPLEERDFEELARAVDPYIERTGGLRGLLLSRDAVAVRRHRAHGVLLSRRSTTWDALFLPPEVKVQINVTEAPQELFAGSRTVTSRVGLWVATPSRTMSRVGTWCGRRPRSGSTASKRSR